MTRPTPTSETPAAPRIAEIVAEFYEDRDQTDERVAVENLARALERAEAAALAARPADHDAAIRLLDEIIEGTTPDRIGMYESLRGWVHKTAQQARARLAPQPEEPR